MISTMEAFSGLKDTRIEGLEALVFQYNNLVAGAKKKSYDILDHRKQEVSKIFVHYVVQIVNEQMQATEIFLTVYLHMYIWSGVIS